MDGRELPADDANKGLWACRGRTPTTASQTLRGRIGSVLIT